MRRLTARQWILVIGSIAALGTLVSGVLPELTHWKTNAQVSRVVFGGIPGWLQAVFYVAIAGMLFVTAWLFANRVKNYQRGKPDNRNITRANWRARVRNLCSGLFMRTLFRDRAAGLMHSFIYFGFVWLFITTVTLEIDHQLPTGWKFLQGRTYEGFSFLADLAGLVFIIGLVWALFRRYVQRPYRIRTKTEPEDLLILLGLLAIGITGFLVEGLRIAQVGQPAFEHWSFVGYPISNLFAHWSVSNLNIGHQVLWVMHVLTFVAFLIVLPTTKLRHMMTSPVNMYLSDRQRPRGAMEPIPNLLEGDVETVGASRIEDFTWKQLFDLDACTVCGRCTSVCPAHQTGKTLDPRQIILKLGNVMAATGEPVVSPTVGPSDHVHVTTDSVFEQITEQELWECTSCKACDEICPVNIEILDKILDMRRYLSLMESKFPPELGNMYLSMENTENPWGISQSLRAQWTSELGFEVPIVDGSTSSLGHEYLYWVGCAGSFDDRNKKVSRAVATLLHHAGVDFAILGSNERCNGDPARRSGNEYLFQMLASQNVEQLNNLGVVKIVTQCPHCFNTLANEYPQLGGHYEVVHHAQLLSELLADGRLQMDEATLNERVTYHDSCYLTRHNDVVAAPREVIGSLGGVEMVEMPRHGKDSFCCGAGGSHMWMEETEGVRVNIARTREALDTQPDRIATACPFCAVMLDDGVKAEGSEVPVEDIAVMLLEALHQKIN